MMTGPARAEDVAERVLMVLTTDRDFELTRLLLASVEVESERCATLQVLAAEIARGVGAVVLTDLALVDATSAEIAAPFGGQPTWSDIPVLLLTPGRDPVPAVRRMITALGNVTVLDRPVWKRSLVSSVLSALRNRRRQYQLRDQLEAQRDAEEALRLEHRRKDEFLATLAHELRNPLAPLRTGLQVLGRPQIDPAVTERMQKMMGRQVNHLVKLIDELLDISRVTTGKLSLENERLDLRAVVEAAVEAAQPALDASRHLLTVSVPPTPVHVDGDAVRLIQCLGNLLSNATKYTPAGGRIDVTLEATGATAFLRVRDNGVGVPPEMLHRVFDMFTQISRTLDRAQGGLGIGLALVRRLVELHGGRVYAQSAGADLGSEFTIELPLAPEGTGASDQGKVPSRASDDAGRSRILVIDDNRDAADALGLMLGDEGRTVLTRYDGASGLAAIVGFRPEAVICDIAMPGMDGYAVARQIRSHPALTDVLLVALSGWGDAEHVRRTREAGFDLHLVKPAGLAEVLGALAFRVTH